MPTKPFIINHLALLILACCSINSHAQNLVPNYSFENLTNCPDNTSELCDHIAPPWICPNAGTTDLYNVCGNGWPNSHQVPSNAQGYQPAHTGDGYVGGFIRWGSGGEYVQAPLLSPLVAGTWYNVSFYVSKAEAFPCGIQHIGAYFSSDPISATTWDYFDVEPQVESDFGFLMDTANWILISGCFQAEGGEAHITVGNFRSVAENPMNPECNPPSSLAYYYVDDIVVEEGTPPEEILFDLGDDVEACFDYEINANHPGPYYHWSTGSSDESIVVAESGMYVLTITDGCSEGIDSVYVAIGGNIPDIDIGPEEVLLCDGETYAISLDPNFAEYEWNDGSNNASYIINAPGSYSVTLDDGCASTSDIITVAYMSPPAAFSLGDDILFCEGEEITLTLDPSLGDITWPDGSHETTFVFSNSGTYSASVSNMCGVATDAITASIVEPPIINTGPSDIDLCTGEFYEVQLDPEQGDILWSDGSTDSEYVITTSGTYSVTVTNLCGSDTDQIVVSQLETPFTDLGPDIQGCAGDSITLAPPLVSGEYQWQDNSEATEYLVTSPGIYTLTISNDCGIAVDSVTVQLLPAVNEPDLGPDVQLCPGEQVVLYANNPGASIQWQDLSSGDSLIVTTSGTYWVHISNACSTTTDTVVVNVSSAPPQINLPDLLSLCQGQSITLDAGITGVNYQWNDNSQNQQLAVNTPGTYSLTVTNACGTDADTVIVADGGPAPFVVLGADAQLCPGEMIVITPTFTDVDTWVWQDGSTSPTFTASAIDTVSVIVNNACGTAYDTLLTSLLPPTPAVDLGPDTALCALESFTLSIAISDVTVSWQDGSNGSDYLVDAPGTFHVTISNSCGQASDTLHVDALPAIPSLDLGPDQSLCPGEIIELSPGLSDVSYLWQDGSTSETFLSTTAGTIMVTITNACGTNADTLEIIESTEGPMVDLGPDIDVCEGEVVELHAGISGVDYLWQDGSSSADFVTTMSGTFILEVSNNCGMDADTIQVDISGTAPSVSLPTDTLLCDQATLILYAAADAETSLLWQDGSTNDSLLVNAEGTYTLLATNDCGQHSDTIVIAHAVAPAPFVIQDDTVLCPGATLLLAVPQTTDAWAWQDGTIDSIRIIESPGVYTLSISNVCGVATDAAIVEYDARMPAIALDTVIDWCIGESIALDASQSFDAIYSWTTGETSAAITVSQPGVYAVTVTVPCGMDSSRVAVVPDPDCMIQSGIYVPNIFSPNADQVNDVFSVHFGSAIKLTSLQGAIYDRWGNVVFESTDIPFTWDGKYGDTSVMPGVYVYRIRCKYEVAGFPREETLAGDVTLIR